MIFYRNQLKGKKSVTKKLKISSFGGIFTNDGEMGANVNFNLGGTNVLTELGGVSAFVPTGTDGLGIAGKNIIRVWFFKRYDLQAQRNDDRIIMLSEDKRLYNFCLYAPDLGVTLVDVRQFSQIPDAVNFRLNGEDVMIFSSPADDMRVYNGVDTPTVFSSAPHAFDFCLHSDKLFVLCHDADALLYADDVDPTNWNTALDLTEYVETGDKTLRIVNMLNYLYLFCSFGIYRVNISGVATAKSVSVIPLYETGDRIFGDTVCLCGDKIFFLTRRGIFAFDGSNVRRVSDDLSGILQGVDNSDACAVSFGGKYFLSCKVNFGNGTKILCENGEFVNNVVLEADTFSGEVRLVRGVDVRRFAALHTDRQDALLVCTGEHTVGVWENSGEYLGLAMPKHWSIRLGDIGSPDVLKVLKYVVVNTAVDVTLSVVADGVEKRVLVRGRQSAQKVPINVSGHTFVLVVESDRKKIHLDKPLLVFEEY